MSTEARVELSDGATLATWTDAAPRSEAPHVVLLHGGPGLWDYLEPVARLLPDATVHRYDQRGCGRSSPSDRHSIVQYVADLDELRRHWGAERLAVVGHSAGAALALAFAAAHPEVVSAVALVGATGLGDWRSAYRVERDRRRAPWAGRFAELDGRRRTRDEETEWRLLSWLPDYADDETGFAARAMAEAPFEIEYAANRLVSATEDELAGWARGIRCPVAVVHGAADPRPWESVRRLAALIPVATTHLLDGAGHLPWVERPADVAEVLRRVAATA